MADLKMAGAWLIVLLVVAVIGLLARRGRERKVKAEQDRLARTVKPARQDGAKQAPGDLP
jgi:hypothetical protein